MSSSARVSLIIAASGDETSPRRGSDEWWSSVGYGSLGCDGITGSKQIADVYRSLAWQSVCLFVCLSVCLSVKSIYFNNVCLSVISARLSICPLVCLSVCLSAQ